MAALSDEAFLGSILGDYKAGILHTFNPIRDVGVRAIGGWAQLQVQVSSKLSLAAGYGLDDTFNEDLSPGFRSYNDVNQANLFCSISQRLISGIEISHWRTNWLALPDGRSFRVEPAISYLF